ncbi:MAG: hypothetical protein A2293_17035 [Elusimicrobia bacterium RIFOXYB2_FULL_49_7]|nr:MAG: hypothetical protein A2293_17035 [Elusimicrobia bacterium RIFOXYB2_FULL_49_7]
MQIIQLLRSKISITFLLIFIDSLFIYISLILAYHLRFFSFVANLFPVTKGIPDWALYHNLIYFIILSWAFVLYKFNLYRNYFLPILDDLIRIMQAVSVGVVFLILATFFYRDFSYSRLTFLFFWIFAVFSLLAYRQLLKFSVRYLLRPVLRRSNTLIVGKENQMIKRILKRHPHLQPCYFPYEDESEIERMKQTVLDKNIDQVILTSHLWNESRLLEMYDWCESKGIDLKFIPDILQICRGEIAIDFSLGIPIFHLKPVSLSGFNLYFKRIVDLVLATIIVSFAWPMLFFLVMLIKLDSSGPFLYSQKRMGYRGNVFSFYKFRTMVMNADALLEKYKAQSERKGPVFKMANDPRITRIGRTLRRYSIDEIPQLINVFKGEMSLVGPRPQVLWEAAAYDDWAKRRLRVLPGMTGLWQVSGRASLSYEEMIELDIFYIENWSLGLDIRILTKTIHAIFSKKGAY